MTDLIRLAERVEALTGPDREVDALIACAIFKTVKTDDDLIYLSPICKSDECAPGTYWLVQRSGRSLQTAPSYTASLDAAMTLVPSYLNIPKTQMIQMKWGVGTLSDDGRPDHKFCAVCRRAGLVGGEPDYDASASTPALALTAAALRAIEAHRGQQ